MSPALKKILLVIVAVLLLIPAVPHALRLLPQGVSFERAQAALEDAGLEVREWQEVPPGLEAVAQVRAQVAGARVDIYQYADRGKLAKHLEYQRDDPGQAMVEAWGLAEALGAARPQRIPTRVGGRGLFMIVATGEDTAALEEIVRIFRAL